MNYTEMEAKVREATNNEPSVILPAVSSLTDLYIVGAHPLLSCKILRMAPSISECNGITPGDIC
jgi:hypothetical protein